MRTYELNLELQSHKIQGDFDFIVTFLLHCPMQILKSRTKFMCNKRAKTLKSYHLFHSPFVVLESVIRLSDIIQPFFQVGMTVGGLLLFVYAPSLCGNVFFHYTTGVGVGICLSLLVLTYFLQKRVRFFSSTVTCY